MTIAAGFFIPEGIVLCSDGEETIGDVTKNPIQKISYAISKHSVVAFAGAGESPYIDTAVERAKEGLSGCKDLQAIRSHLRKKLIRFFDYHLAAFPEKERPGVELLIGVSARDGCELFQYTGRAFHHVDRQAIGIGKTLANNLISEYCHGSDSLENLAKASIYMLSVVKRSVTGCGGYTALLLLRRDRNFIILDPYEIERLEIEMAAEWRKASPTWKQIILSKKFPRSTIVCKQGKVRIPRFP